MEPRANYTLPFTEKETEAHWKLSILLWIRLDLQHLDPESGLTLLLSDGTVFALNLAWNLVLLLKADYYSLLMYFSLFPSHSYLAYHLY